MKKIFVMMCLALLSNVAMAEIIDSVSFNPSRLGRYEHLKVSDSLSTGGTVYTQFLSISSKNKVTISKDDSTPLTIFNAQVPMLEMGDTELITDNLSIFGGSLEVTGNASFNGNFNINPASFSAIHAYKLNLPNSTVSVEGEGESFWNGIGMQKTLKKGLVLGGVDIPAPATARCEALQWYTRKDSVTNKTYKVLGCKGPAVAYPNCTMTMGSVSTASFNVASDASLLDTCDGSLTPYNGGCTDALVSQGSCEDYYFDAETTYGRSLTGKWNDSSSSLSEIPSNSYKYVCGKPSDTCKQTLKDSLGAVPGSADNACSIAYDLDNGINTGTNTCSLYYCEDGGTGCGSSCGPGLCQRCAELKLTCTFQKGKYNKFKKRTITFSTPTSGS
ncbi:MAG: hypothetical protein IKL48_01055 [Elusimicrobiaceae bacterium]|nr:hypothetical protein [Elusimicrobiaceae bacterium]